MDLTEQHERHLLKTYGMWGEEYQDLYKKQNGLCAICGTDSPKTKNGKLMVDHCHRTGKIRGLLCAKCNNGLGQFGDNVRGLLRAVEYLLMTESPAQIRCQPKKILVFQEARRKAVHGENAPWTVRWKRLINGKEKVFTKCVGEKIAAYRVAAILEKALKLEALGETSGIDLENVNRPIAAERLCEAI